MARIEPAMAALTPSVAASAQNTMSGPNSARTKRAVAASFGRERAIGSGPRFVQRGDDRLDRLGPIDDPHVINTGKDCDRRAERRQLATIRLGVHQFVVGAREDRNAASGSLEGALPVRRRGVVLEQPERVDAG